MVGLIFATGMEARPFLALTGAKAQATRPFKIYCTGGSTPLPVVISGIGKVAAAQACQYLIWRYKVTHVLNAGVVGSLYDVQALQVCRLVRVESAIEGDHKVFGRRPAALTSSGQFGRELFGVKLVTADEPVFDSERRAAFGSLGQVVDMEGAAIARTAALFDIGWDMIKSVSDMAGPVERQTLLRNLQAASDILAAWVWRELAGHP